MEAREGEEHIISTALLGKGGYGEVYKVNPSI
jgi:hypothetical protein